MTNLKFMGSVEFLKNGLIIGFTDEGKEVFNTAGYEINSNNGCGNILFDHEHFGEQHIELAPGGSEEARTLEYLIDNPEFAIDKIKARIQMLKEDEELAA